MMKHRSSNDDNDKPSSPRKSEAKFSAKNENRLSRTDLLQDLSNPPSRPMIKRRNSTGTIYIDTTMAVQDNQATIRCVCAVIRAHMIEAETERIIPRFLTFDLHC